MPSMRDVFWNSIYDDMLHNNELIVLSSDFGAIALDKYRVNFPGRYINTGISEQNTILMAAGLALSGKKVFVTSITPFITYRCFEQIRLYPAGMNLPIVIVGVGAGVCYEDSGPTHHGTEDISLLRSLPNMQIFTPCDNFQTAYFAKRALKIDGPSYIRLDRAVQNNIYNSNDIFDEGFRCIKPITEINIITLGNMVHCAISVANKIKKYENIEIGVIDAYKLPINMELLKDTLTNAKVLITLEEHNLAGGFGSYITEMVTDSNVDIKIKRFGLDFSQGFSHHYGGRRYIHEAYGMGEDDIISYITGGHFNGIR